VRDLRAALNFGDCLSRATAPVAGEPLPAKGVDFTKTDVPCTPGAVARNRVAGNIITRSRGGDVITLQARETARLNQQQGHTTIPRRQLAVPEAPIRTFRPL
jgi:hypothetical protein